MKTGNFVELEFIVKSEIQRELTNLEHISRFFHSGGKPFIGMVGQTFTRQISQASSDQLLKYINVTEWYEY